MQRLFSSLDPREALIAAILIEERNHHIYRRLGDLFHKLCSTQPQLQLLFHDLASKEKQHGAILKEHLARYGTVQHNLTEDEILDSIEVPRLDLEDILEAANRGDTASALKLSLEMAIATENRAVTFYSDLSKNTADPELRSLYQQLLGFEQDHVGDLSQVLV